MSKIVFWWVGKNSGSSVSSSEPLNVASAKSISGFERLMSRCRRRATAFECSEKALSTLVVHAH
jgi:hypothetical protein